MSRNWAATGTAVEEVPLEREVLGWLEFGDASRQLAHSIAESTFVPEIVVAIARGGLLLAGSVAYALGVKSCGSINVEFYTGVDERLAKPEILPPLLDGASLAGKRVLLVDDVSDSGHTLSLAVELLRNLGADVRSVTLYSKPRTILAPDFCWRSTDRWIVFPWSALPPVTEGH
ncbi:MAG: phosphoribosyltransferase [Naasia sp.]|jgi:hypoxanthine phosphoribosyltransferase|uniref:phosphoribosyltransferase n=1 Tax=Naasia sp. TaxID=2546198 RepID=UPI00262B988D|nr:phosphoribosyltransferase [Naasia sp.]MCU1569552.1 phosphoribosyltransferase [Naasia sp.]